MAHTWLSNLPTYLNCGYSLAIYSSATQKELFQNTATNTKFIHILFSLHRLTLFHSLFIIFFFLSFCYDSTNYLHKYQKTNEKREKQFHNADDENNSNNKSTEQCPYVEDEASIMAVHTGIQERLSAFSHFAATSCRIAGGPKRH